jgi:hypothetical protein
MNLPNRSAPLGDRSDALVTAGRDDLSLAALASAYSVFQK